MKSIKAIALLLLLLPTVVLAQKKTKKPSIPEIFDHARYVYVEAVDGEEFNPNLYPADRNAIADVRDALHKWGRYNLTIDRAQADLVFVVRKGRLAGAEATGSIGTGAISAAGFAGRTITGAPAAPAGDRLRRWWRGWSAGRSAAGVPGECRWKA
jgi:hypothetical protein